MRRSKSVVIGDLLPLFLKEFGLEEKYRDYQLLKLWDEILGPVISKATISKKLVNKRLYVQLSSSVVRDELYMMRTAIVSEFNNRAGKSIIDELILK
jgi:hypothetical protein